jgi:hypothetical protein
MIGSCNTHEKQDESKILILSLMRNKKWQSVDEEYTGTEDKQ